MISSGSGSELKCVISPVASWVITPSVIINNFTLPESAVVTLYFTINSY